MESLHALDVCRLTDTLTNILSQRPTVRKKVPISFISLSDEVCPGANDKTTKHQAWWVWAADGIFLWFSFARTIIK